MENRYFSKEETYSLEQMRALQTFRLIDTVYPGLQQRPLLPQKV